MAKPRTKSDLMRKDWIDAAFAVLVESGIDSVRVEPLAIRLGVTKGSFYWHFIDRGDLLAAMLDFWETGFTRQLIVEAASLPSPAARLRTVATQALVKKMHGLDNARAEMAMQAWAARDGDVAARLRAIDEARLDYLRRELAALGLSPNRAKTGAAMLYQSLMGVYALRAYNSAVASDDAFLAAVELVLAQAKH
jgi:AcrR family transcriptional regulator